MDFYEECKSETNQHQSLKVDNLLASLNKKDAESLKKALLDPDVPTRAIERVLRKNKIECGCWAINQWRRTNGITLRTTNTLGGK